MLLVSSGCALAAATVAPSLDQAGPASGWLVPLGCMVLLMMGYHPAPSLGWLHVAGTAASGALAVGLLVGIHPENLPPAALLHAALLASAVAALGLSPPIHRRRVERALAAHADHSGDGWVVADRRGRVVGANAAAARALFPQLASGPVAKIVGKALPKTLLRAMADPASRARVNLGEERFFEVSTSAAGRGRWFGRTHTAVLREVTGRRHQEQRLRRMANNDSLTGLWNRRRFLEHLEARVAHHQDDADRHLAVFFIDLDSFKAINDELGHAAGDQCLRAVSQRFLVLAHGDHPRAPRDQMGRIRPFRLAGDEFALVADGIADRAAAEELARALVEEGRTPIQDSERTFSTSLSVGIALCPEDGTNTETLMKRADAAMYEAKRRGRDRFVFYDASFDRGEDRAKLIESGLRRALEEGGLRLHYQPKVDAKTLRLGGFEALARWSSAELGSVGPAEFIPIAERSGLISELGAWCLREACRQLRVWSDQGFDVVPISVNVSSLQFSKGDLGTEAAEALREFALDPRFLELELTESLILQENDETLLCLRDLRAIGVRVSLDDFGSGYSALTYLGRFPLDVLKLDYGFVRDIEHNDAAAGIVEAVVSMAHTLGLEVVAEGVEDAEQAQRLAAMGCDQLQGFLYAAAVPWSEAEQLPTRESETHRILAPQSAPSIGREEHGAVATVAPVSRVVTTETAEEARELEVRTLMIDDAQQSLGTTALRLTRLGFDLHYAPNLEEAADFVTDEKDALRLVLVSPAVDLARVAVLRDRLSEGRQSAVPMVVMGERPKVARRHEIREARATWVLWAPFEDGEMSFLLHSALESSDAVGHRAEQRVPVNENVWMRVGQVRYVGVLTTLSVGGCFVEMVDPPEPGTWMRLDFELPECPVRVFGEVIYRRGDGRSLGELCQGVGIHFSDLDKESEEAVQQLVESIAARYAP